MLLKVYIYFKLVFRKSFIELFYWEDGVLFIFKYIWEFIYVIIIIKVIELEFLIYVFFILGKGIIFFIKVEIIKVWKGEKVWRMIFYNDFIFFKI